jgi:hypothetical protein
MSLRRPALEPIHRAARGVRAPAGSTRRGRTGMARRLRPANARGVLDDTRSVLARVAQSRGGGRPGARTHRPGRMHDGAGIAPPPDQPGGDGTGRFGRTRAPVRRLRLRAVIVPTGPRTQIGSVATVAIRCPRCRLPPRITAAHSFVSFGFFPFVAFPAAFPTSFSRCLACLRRRRAFFDELVAAPSIRLVARSSFPRMPDGTISSPHSGPWSAASIVQRGVVHRSVVVVITRGDEIVKARR